MAIRTDLFAIGTGHAFAKVISAAVGAAVTQTTVTANIAGITAEVLALSSGTDLASFAGDASAGVFGALTIDTSLPGFAGDTSTRACTITGSQTT